MKELYSEKKKKEARNFPKFSKRYKSTDSRTSMSPKKINTHAWLYHRQIVENSRQEKYFESSQRKLAHYL